MVDFGHVYMAIGFQQDNIYGAFIEEVKELKKNNTP